MFHFWKASSFLGGDYGLIVTTFYYLGLILVETPDGLSILTDLLDGSLSLLSFAGEFSFCGEFFKIDGKCFGSIDSFLIVKFACWCSNLMPSKRLIPAEGDLFLLLKAPNLPKPVWLLISYMLLSELITRLSLTTGSLWLFNCSSNSAESWVYALWNVSKARSWKLLKLC